MSSTIKIWAGQYIEESLTNQYRETTKRKIQLIFEMHNTLMYNNALGKDFILFFKLVPKI